MAINERMVNLDQSIKRTCVVCIYDSQWVRELVIFFSCSVVFHKTSKLTDSNETATLQKHFLDSFVLTNLLKQLIFEKPFNNEFETSIYLILDSQMFGSLIFAQILSCLCPATSNDT